ncbi:MAG: hypothetical protein M3Q39_01700 [Actinomycetota bacterium]|nr:hypothetical protein [Actinomycetota bacterium]
MIDEFDWSKGTYRGSVMQNRGVILAETDQIELYSNGVKILLSILNHPEALVTDLSDLGDFKPDSATMRILGNTYNRILHMNELIWELAKELKADDPS